MKVDIFNTEKKYEIIYADPPWLYNDTLGGNKTEINNNNKEGEEDL